MASVSDREIRTIVALVGCQFHQKECEAYLTDGDFELSLVWEPDNRYSTNPLGAIAVRGTNFRGSGIVGHISQNDADNLFEVLEGTPEWHHFLEMGLPMEFDIHEARFDGDVLKWIRMEIVLAHE